MCVAQQDSGPHGLSHEGGLYQRRGGAKAAASERGAFSNTPAPAGIQKLDWMSRHEVCGAARLSVHFLMFGFSTPAHAQTRLAAQQPRSSAAMSNTNDVNTTSEFETWRWPPSRLSSSLRPAALAHRPGSRSSTLPCGKTRDAILRCHGLAAVLR